MLKSNKQNAAKNTVNPISESIVEPPSNELLGQFSIVFNPEDYETDNEYVKSVKLKTQKPIRAALKYKVRRKIQNYAESGLDLNNKIRFSINDGGNLYTRQTNFLVGTRKTETILVTIKDEVELKFFSSLPDIEMEFVVYSDTFSDLEIIARKSEIQYTVVMKEKVNFDKLFQKPTHLIGLDKKYSFFKTIVVEDEAGNDENAIKKAKTGNYLMNAKVSTRYIEVNHDISFEKNQSFNQVAMPTTSLFGINEMKINKGEPFRVGLKRLESKKYTEVRVYVIGVEVKKYFN